MDLLRAWAAGAAAWLAWAAASVLLHLWLLPLGALAVPHVRLLWVASSAFAGYTLVALAAGLAHSLPHRARSGRHRVATWALPALGVPLEAAAVLSGEASAADSADAVAVGATAADAAVLAATLLALAAGAALGSRAAHLMSTRTRGDTERRVRG